MFIAHQLQYICDNVIQISHDLSDEMKLWLNVSFYSAIGLNEKFYAHIFLDLSENLQAKCVYENQA